VSLNHVVLIGKCADAEPKLTYNAASAKPECKLTLIVEEGKGEQKFLLYVPIFVYGNGSEVAGEEVDAGDLIAIDGRLSWKSALKKNGSKLGLCVSCFGVEVLVKAEVPVEVTAGSMETSLSPEYTSGSDHGAVLTEQPGAHETQKHRKPHYPRSTKERWVPQGLVSEPSSQN
jgi:single-stranded DNA-binding protein